jgi:hypothetical protein
MKRSVSLLVLSFCVVLTLACGLSPEAVTTQAPTAAPRPTDTLAPATMSPDRHYEASGGFSYIPPAGWELVESSRGEYKVVRGPEADGFAPNITIVDEPFSGSLEEYVSSSLENMGDFFTELQLISQEEFDPDEGPAGVRIVTENVQSGRALHQTYYLFDAGAKKLVITCTRLAGAGEEMDAACEAGVKTLRIESE